MKEIIKKSPILGWVLVFVLANLLFRENGATNEMSRYATMRAMTDHLSFQINDYQNWTVDWSIKDGKIFSNKAPGPMLLGFPIFIIIDQFSKKSKKNIVNKNGSRTTKVSSTPRVLMALFYQVLPFSLLMILIVHWMQLQTSVPILAIHFFALASLFGNTSALFMNIFFGHGMSALFVLALSYTLYNKKFFYVGLFFGLTLLTEYATAFIFPAFILSLFVLRKDIGKKEVLDIIKGGLAPGILWCLYHYQTVGSIFKIPAQYQNPAWIDTSAKTKKLWGMFAMPDPQIFAELLFGFRRGILWTQPWIFISWALGLQCIQREDIAPNLKALAAFVLLSSGFLLLMNSAFNGWHGGATSGPRYLSMIFPASALLVALCYKEIQTNILKYLLWAGLILSLVFRVLVYGSRALAAEQPNLWPYLWNDLLEKPGMKGEIRALALIILLLIAAYQIYRKQFKK